jgi:ACS family glucarate transporter-like MFS transporter
MDPKIQRGLVQGVMFSGARIGAAFTLPVVAWMVESLGWRMSFVVLGGVGVAWAVFWFAWFRDDPECHPRISEDEKQLILRNRENLTASAKSEVRLTAGQLLGSGNVWLLMAQYFASNFTFFFALSWLFSYVKDRYGLSGVQTGFYAALPPLAGAFGNWTAGALIDWIYRRGHHVASRKIPAVVGFCLSALGLLASTRMDTALGAVLCFTVAVFGADMTIAPSWSVCIDIGRRNSGTVSGTMNMAGNLGSFVTALAFPHLLDWTASYAPFFYTAAALNVLAVGAWLATRPDKALEASS